MSFLGLWLIAVGVADLVAGLTGAAPHPRRALVGAGLGVVVLGAGAALVGYGPGMSLTAAAGGVLLVPWTLLRVGGWTNRRIATALALHLATLAALLALSGLIPEPGGGIFRQWLETLPFLRLGDGGWEGPLLVAGSFFWLGATANSLVRMVIFLVEKEIDLEKREEPLRGGRIIGPVERWLIFSLVLGGIPVAAGFITAAKSLARFPELGLSKNIKVDTEYLLIGSLVSWALALAPVPLLT